MKDRDIVHQRIHQYLDGVKRETNHYLNKLKEQMINDQDYSVIEELPPDELIARLDRIVEEEEKESQ